MFVLLVVSNVQAFRIKSLLVYAPTPKTVLPPMRQLSILTVARSADLRGVPLCAPQCPSG